MTELEVQTANIKKITGRNIIYLSQFFKMVEDTKSVNLKVELLKTYFNHSQFYRDSLTKVLLTLFHEKGKLNIPEGFPEDNEKKQKPLDINLGNTDNVYSLLKILGRFNENIKSDNYIANNIKREQFYIKIVTGMHTDEFMLAIALKDRNVENLYPSLTANLFSLAFPDMSFIGAK